MPKWREYKDLASWARDLLFQTGIGISASPIPRPAPPTLDWVASTLDAAALFVRITWMDSSEREGAGSIEQAISVPSGNALRVAPPSAPAGVAGWSVYAGEASGELSRQNTAVLAPGSAWVEPALGLVSGETLGEGQAPDYFKSVPRFLQRG